MASISQLQTTKDGRRFWKISVSRGYGLTPYTTRFYWQIKENGDPVARSTAERALNKAVAEFERACAAGEILTRAEVKKQAAIAAAEAAKIKTFEQYGEQVFMPAKKVACAEKTRRYYQYALSKHLYPAFGGLRMSEISAAQLSSFFLSLQQSGLSHSTVIGVFVTANQIFKSAMLDDTIAQNPMFKVQRPRQHKDVQKKEIDAFTADEVRQIKIWLQDEPLMWRAMVQLMTETGIRRGEACALRWTNVDIKDCTANIVEGLCYTPEAGTFTATPKSGKTREVYFSRATSELLRQLRSEQAISCVSQYVFSQRGSPEPIHPDSLNRYLRKFSKKHAIDIHPHKLRHTFASVAIINGADIASTSEILGHADKSTTLRMYTHADKKSKQNAAALVASAIE